MKSVLTAIVGLALGALLFSVPMAGAAGGDGTGPDGKGCPMMSANSDRPCKGKGRMMHHNKKGRGAGQGKGFVDANGDGICDHYAKMMAEGGKCPGCGKGAGKGHKMHNGHGKGYVDADGNGICDHHPDNAKPAKAAK
jgi:ssDNA-binding Zn-finger/Zn-ribbon topoisomerase 1